MRTRQKSRAAQWAEAERIAETVAGIQTSNGSVVEPAAPSSPPMVVHIPLRIVGKIRDIAKEGMTPAVSYSADQEKMLTEAYRIRGEALLRIERLIGLVSDLGVEKALERWEAI